MDMKAACGRHPAEKNEHHGRTWLHTAHGPQNHTHSLVLLSAENCDGQGLGLGFGLVLYRREIA